MGQDGRKGISQEKMSGAGIFGKRKKKVRPWIGNDRGQEGIARRFWSKSFVFLGFLE